MLNIIHRLFNVQKVSAVNLLLSSGNSHYSDRYFYFYFYFYFHIKWQWFKLNPEPFEH